LLVVRVPSQGVAPNSLSPPNLNEEIAVADPYELTNTDWGKIHAKAWGDKVFRELLETDPTEAIQQYVKEAHPAYVKAMYPDAGAEVKIRIKMVKLRAAPEDVPEEFWDDVNPFPPSCC
jgi:hypothetical protein